MRVLRSSYGSILGRIRVNLRLLRTYPVLVLPFLPLGLTILVGTLLLLFGFQFVIYVFILLAIGAVESIVAIRMTTRMLGDIRQGGPSVGKGPALFFRSLEKLPNLLGRSAIVYPALFVILNLGLLASRLMFSGPVLLGVDLQQSFGQARSISVGANMLGSFTVYNRALGLQPDFEIGYLDQWDDLALMGVSFDPDAEMAFVSETISNLALAHAANAIALGEQSRQKEGMRMAEEALRLDSSLAYVQFVWGFLNQRERNLYVAIEAFENAIKADPVMFEPYLFLGIVHSGRENSFLAIDYLTQAIEIGTDPADISMAYTHRGLTYATLKRYEECFADLEAALSLDPSNDLAVWVKGVVSDQIALEEENVEQGTEPAGGLGLNP